MSQDAGDTKETATQFRSDVDVEARKRQLEEQKLELEVQKLKLEAQKLQAELGNIALEPQKLKVERSKRTWTAVSGVMIPLLIGLSSGVYTYVTVKAASESKPRSEILELIWKNPGQRKQIIKDWNDLFPGDLWLNDIDANQGAAGAGPPVTSGKGK